ncbi:MAG: ABC transporter substrate-binding protein [Deltaproteobacteria bacterium]|nr:ABC transporter substrate-binding protein [Deltaproteobacteria bacterium]
MIFCSTPAFPNDIDKLNLLTEEYPPYNYSENGEAKGIFVDSLDEILKMAGSTLTKKDVQILPWARGYNLCLKKKNILLFSMVFTKKRKPLFKWVGPVIQSRIVLHAKKSRRIKVNNSEDMKKYKIGVIIDDIGEQILTGLGIPEYTIQSVSRADSNVKKLVDDRIDLWAYGEATGRWFIKKSGYNAKDFESVFVLKRGEMYFAFNKNVPDNVIKKLQDALDKLKAEGRLQDIFNKYIR